MNQEFETRMLSVLEDIRDGQRQMIAQLESQRALAEKQLKKSQERVEESVGLQREALQRQQSIVRLAVPGILICIGLIGYLIVKYF